MNLALFPGSEIYSMCIPGELEAEITPFDTCKAVSGEQEAFSPPDDIERAVFASKYTASLVALIRNSLGLEVRFVADKVCASVPPDASSAEWQKAYPASFLNFPFFIDFWV